MMGYPKINRVQYTKALPGSSSSCISLCGEGTAHTIAVIHQLALQGCLTDNLNVNLSTFQVSQQQKKQYPLTFELVIRTSIRGHLHLINNLFTMFLFNDE